MSSLRAWLDGTPLAVLALTVLREATGRDDPLEPIRPADPSKLARGSMTAFWSLSAGVGTSTLAALIAHRSAAAGEPPLLVDLDRWAPSLALAAKLEGATVADALLRPGCESTLISRWSQVAFLPGSPGLHRVFDGVRLVELIRSAAAGRATVLDLGSGADALDGAVLATVDRLVVTCGPRVAQLQAAFCGAPLLAAVAGVGLAVIGAGDEDARRIAERLPWPLLGAIPTDAFLARDDFAARAPTLRAVDGVIRRLA